MKNTNTFQTYLLDPNNIHIIHSIIKLYHPNLLEEYPNPHKVDKMIKVINRIKVNTLYDSIIIDLAIPSSIYPNIFIKLSCEYPLKFTINHNEDKAISDLLLSYNVPMCAKVCSSIFCKEIIKDYNINPTYKHIIKYNQFPIKDGKRKIKASCDSIIVDHNGNEFPYMLNRNTRNDDKLIDFDYIYIIHDKQLDQILKESNLSLKTDKCKICEGNGWYTNGTRYYYKDIFCEI